MSDTFVIWALVAVIAALLVTIYQLIGRTVYTAPLESPNDTALLRRCQEEKRYAYYERNLLAAMFAKWLIAHDENVVVGFDYDDHFKTWGTALYIVTEEFGQLVWHFHDEHAWMVRELGVPPFDGKWDGRSKQDKYAVIEKWLRIPLQGYNYDHG